MVAALLWSVATQAQTDKKDFDFACAIATGAQMSLSQNQSYSAGAIAAFSFYLGRLSVRDDTTDWTVVVQGRIAEKQYAAPSPRLLTTCLDFYTSKLKN
jgi:hypothetical protein